MKVKTLINKLKKMPQEVEVIIPNYSLYKDNLYIATCVDYEGNCVFIDTDYKRTTEDL